MKPALFVSLIVFGLSACATSQPSKSDCFVNGRAVCKFTPIPELWAQEP